MKQIIAPTTSNSDLVNGVFFNSSDNNFYDRLKNKLSHTWVIFCYWSSINSLYGSEVADNKTNLFCSKYGIENKSNK